MVHTDTPAVIFWDMEGTLVDTETLHFKAWQWLVEEHGEGVLTLEEYAPCVGRKGKDNIAYLHTLKHFRGDLEDLRLLRYNKFEALRAQGIPPVVENINLVKDIKKYHPDIRHVVVSSTTRADLETNVTATGIADHFETLVSYEEEPGMARKPAPDLYLYALKKTGAEASLCLAFEDTESGVRAATAAHIPTVAVPTALTTQQNFSLAKLVVAPGTPHEHVRLTLGL